jgi:heavy metal translocating P-type ATPase
VSHTTTCECDEHPPPLGEGRGARLIGAVSQASAATGVQPPKQTRPKRAWSFLTLREVRWSALALLLFLLGLLCWEARAHVVAWVLFAGCYVVGGWEPGLAGLRALRAKTLDVDLLMVVAALVAAGIGQVVDGGLLIVIFATSGALEAVATKHTRDSVRSLLDLAPEQAARVGPDGSETLVDTSELAVGDMVLVRPGERIGADGRVTDGVSEVDQASVTGEPLPVTKQPEAEVFAGTLNGTGLLRVRVERAAADSVVARIVFLVEQASATKARTQLFIEKVEQRYSVAMVAATVALFVIPLAAGGDLRPTLLRAMTFMIVASPCAVVLATMPPLLSAIANAGRHGVLVKSAVVMELLGRTGLVAFDKTGTLTEGMPRLSDVLPVEAAGLDVDTMLCLAAAAELGSEHPLGRAVVAAAQERGLILPQATEFSSVAGRGVQAIVGGRRVGVGSPLLLGDAPSADGPEAALVAQLQGSGKTVVIVTLDGHPAGVLGLADRLRPAAAAAVAALGDLTGRAPVLLTGDNRAAACLLAESVGITDVRAGLLPQDKVTAVHELQADGTAVAVIGDGVNDAPSLAAATLGLAMGRGSADLTLETADAVIVRNELGTVPAVIDLSRRARRVVTQNLWFAATVICVLVTIDLAGHLPLPLGVAGHEGSTVIGRTQRAPLARPPFVERLRRITPRTRVASRSKRGSSHCKWSQPRGDWTQLSPSHGS